MGGVSKKAAEFLPLLHLPAPTLAEQLRDAGIIGAAALAADLG